MNRFSPLPILFVLIISCSVVSGCDYITGKALEAPAVNQQQQVINISATEAYSLIQENTDNPDFIIIDVRTPSEYANGHIENAVLVEYSSTDFKEKIGKYDKNKECLIYCQSGGRSIGARKVMEGLGFLYIYHLNGGIAGWLAEGLTVVK